MAVAVRAVGWRRPGGWGGLCAAELSVRTGEKRGKLAFDFSRAGTKTVMTWEEVFAAIPHRPPFLLVDEVLSCDQVRIVCRKLWHREEFFFAGHYPGQPMVPGVLLCESAMQAGAILLSRKLAAEASGTEAKGGLGGVPVATRMNDVRFKQMVRPGDETQAEVVLTERLANAYFLTAKVTCKEKLAVRFEFACTVAEAEPNGRNA